MQAKPDDITKALAVLREEDFDDACRPLWSLITERFEKGLDIGLTALLDTDPKNTLMEIYQSKATITLMYGQGYLSATLFHKALYVRELSIKRHLVQTLTGHVMGLEAGNDVFDSMSSIEQDVAALYPADVRGGLVDVGTIVLSEIDKASLSRQEKEKGYIRTGFYEIDERIGGYMPGEFIVIGARPGMGKTGFGVSSSINLSRDGVPHAFFSVEMTKEQIGRRYVSQLAGIPVTRLAYATLTDAERQRMEDVAPNFIELNKYLQLDDASDATVTYIRNRTKQLIGDHGIKMIIVDYLQKMPTTGKTNSREQEVSALSGGLAKIAKDCNIVVMAFVQLNRGVEGRPDKRPSLADIRDSGSVEQDAHRVGFIYRPSYYGIEDMGDGTPSKGRAEIDWQKTRDGATGICRLAFDDELTRFRDLYEGF